MGVGGAWGALGVEQDGKLKCSMLQHRTPRSPRILKSSSDFQGILKPNSYLSAYQILKTFKISTYSKCAFVGAGIAIVRWGADGGPSVGRTLSQVLWFSACITCYRLLGQPAECTPRTPRLGAGFSPSMNIPGKFQGLICILAPPTRLLGKCLAVLLMNTGSPCFLT